MRFPLIAGIFLGLLQLGTFLRYSCTGNYLFDTLTESTATTNPGASNNNDQAQAAAVVPQFQVDPIYQKEHDRIDSISPDQRCQAFGWTPLPDETPRRRLFMGSMIANEGMDMLEIHAMEVYNVYHVIALVESNTTHSASPRTMRYRPGTQESALLTKGNLFGNQTQVLVDYWLEDWPDLMDMNREVEQRTKIVELWRQAGMTINDIGVMGDLDEVVSRDFLRALQVCDVPQFRLPADPNHRPSCQAPKLSLSAIQFEGTPYCIKEYEWFHPDVISGQCIGGIGDPSERVTPLRQHKRQYGNRHESYGYADYKNYPRYILEQSTPTRPMFPLFAAQDIREVAGSSDGLTSYQNTPGHGQTAAYGVAFHLHNWFSPSLQVLRNKYKTYGHSNPYADSGPLASKNEDLDVLVRCALDLGNDRTNFGYHYYYDGKGNNKNHSSLEEQAIRQEEILKYVNSLGGNRPIYFVNTTYTKERHELLVKMVQEDEAKYGPSTFPKDTNGQLIPAQQ